MRVVPWTHIEMRTQYINIIQLYIVKDYYDCKNPLAAIVIGAKKRENVQVDRK